MTDETNLNYGAAIRRLREDRRMTLESTAQAAGVSASYLSEVERGLKRPSTDVVAKIAGAFGMAPSAFLGYVESLSGRYVRESLRAARQAVEMRSAAVPQAAPAAQEPASPHLHLLVAHARQLDEGDLKTLVDLARRLLRRGKSSR